MKTQEELIDALHHYYTETLGPPAVIFWDADHRVFVAAGHSVRGFAYADEIAPDVALKIASSGEPAQQASHSRGHGERE